MSDDAIQESQDLWRMGHRRPWWQWNVITLFVALFLLVWARELLRLSQTATWLTCVCLLLAWAVGPTVYLDPLARREKNSVETTDELSDDLGLRFGYMLAAAAMFGAVVLTGGFVPAIFSVLAAVLYAAAVQKRS